MAVFKKIRLALIFFRKKKRLYERDKDKASKRVNFKKLTLATQIVKPRGLAFTDDRVSLGNEFAQTKITKTDKGAYSKFSFCLKYFWPSGDGRASLSL